MDLNINNITFVIVCFKSDKIIRSCLNSLPLNSKKIIIENSYNIDLKKELEKEYDNIKVILNENTGMGASNNLGIKMSDTDYAFVLNPDVTFQENTFENLVNSSREIDDFAILSPINDKEKYPNYKIKKDYAKNYNNLLVDVIDGFSMLINKKKFINKFFDENFFLYLENDDLCLRAKKINENIYIIKNSVINHLGGSSTDMKFYYEIEYLRNWHWMWSKFYFNKKHYGFFNALISVSKNFFSSQFKYIYYLLTFNTFKKNIYKMRFFGLVNSIQGKKSWYRMNI